jgi:hypothetical protein
MYGIGPRVIFSIVVFSAMVYSQDDVKSIS